MVIAAVIINLAGGVVYSWSIISKELILNLHWTSTNATLPYTVNNVAMSFFWTLGGRIGDKHGPRISALLGGVLMGGGIFLTGFCTTPLTMVITYGIVAGAGFGFTNSATTATAIKWFPAEKRGLISGICLSGAAFASVYMAPIIQFLLKNTDIYTTFHCIGIGILVVIVSMALLLSQPQDTLSPSGAKDSVDWKEIFKNAHYYKLCTLNFLGKAVGLMIIGHIAVIAVKQAQWEGGVILVSLVAVFNGIGRLTGGAIADKIGVRNSFRIIFLLQTANLLVFYYYNTGAYLIIGTAIAGFYYGGLIANIPAGVASAFGTKNLATNIGLVNTFALFSAALGPLIAGRVFDITGNYHYAYLIAAALLVLCFAVASSMKENQNTG